MRNFNGLDWTALIIVLLGAFNWGLIGFFNFDLVAAIFGGAARFIYAIVGLAAIYVAVVSPSFVHKLQPRVQRTAHQPM